MVSLCPRQQPAFHLDSAGFRSTCDDTGNGAACTSRFAAPRPAPLVQQGILEQTGSPQPRNSVATSDTLPYPKPISCAPGLSCTCSNPGIAHKSSHNTPAALFSPENQLPSVPVSLLLTPCRRPLGPVSQLITSILEELAQAVAEHTEPIPPFQPRQSRRRRRRPWSCC